MPIKDEDYNKARDILIKAGSKTAEKSHVKHTGKKGSPDGHGKSLVSEAKDEWGDKITPAQTSALSKAEKAMGI